MNNSCQSCGSNDYEILGNSRVCSYCGYKIVQKSYKDSFIIVGSVVVLVMMFDYIQSSSNDIEQLSSKVEKDVSPKKVIQMKQNSDKRYIIIKNSGANIGIQRVEYDENINKLSIDNTKAHIKIQEIKKRKKDSKSYKNMLKDIAHIRSIKDPKKLYGKKRVYYEDGKKITTYITKPTKGRVTKTEDGFVIDNQNSKFDKQTMYRYSDKKLKYFEVVTERSERYEVIKDRPKGLSD